MGKKYTTKTSHTRLRVIHKGYLEQLSSDEGELTYLLPLLVCGESACSETGGLPGKSSSPRNLPLHSIYISTGRVQHSNKGSQMFVWERLLPESNRPDISIPVHVELKLPLKAIYSFSVQTHTTLKFHLATEAMSKYFKDFGGNYSCAHFSSSSFFSFPRGELFPVSTFIFYPCHCKLHLHPDDLVTVMFV